MSEWNSGLLSCCSDFGVLVKLYVAPCIFIPLQKSKLEGKEGFGECFFNFCVISSLTWRHHVRTSYGISGNCCIQDVLIPYLCGPCSNCQAYREVDTRGPLANKKVDGDKEWSTPFTGCMEDTTGCILSYMCGGLPSSFAVSRTNGSSCLFNFCFMPYAWQRQIIRQDKGIQGSCFNDLLMSYARSCLPCIFFLDEARLVRETGGFKFDSSLLMGGPKN